MVEALENDNDYIARRVEPLEETIDDMVLLLKNRHTDRLCKALNFSANIAIHISNLLLQLRPFYHSFFQVASLTKYIS